MKNKKKEEEVIIEDNDDYPLLHTIIRTNAKVGSDRKPSSSHYMTIPSRVVQSEDYMFKPGDVVEIILDRENASMTLMLYAPDAYVQKARVKGKKSKEMTMRGKAKELVPASLAP